ncbi:hypothetical protein [Streptomyces sp. NPDC005548]|uniref:hypothetical protein n=1 Tax=Streptomyces sp. NPDC005548 TaxID=3364724 RepID=UPI0036C7F43D
MTSTSTDWAALEERLAQVKRPVRTFSLCQDTAIRERFLEAQQADAQAQQKLKELPKEADRDVRSFYEQAAKTAKTELTAAQKAYDAHVIVLRFTALERKHLEALQAAHPAGEADEAEGQDWAMETFAPALISAASMDGMPVEKAALYLDTWAPGDARDLWNAAWSIQHTKRTDLGKG